MAAEATDADPFDLRRFLAAQDEGGAYAGALVELRDGRKRGHWIWFVFPQIAGLGSSPMSRRYAIRSLDEARAYLAHPVLGPRLHECVEALLAADPSRSAEQILGPVDALKLRSSMTLFARAAPTDEIFPTAVTRFCEGEADPRTDRLLNPAP